MAKWHQPVCGADQPLPSPGQQHKGVNGCTSGTPEGGDPAGSGRAFLARSGLGTSLKPRKGGEKEPGLLLPSGEEGLDVTASPGQVDI